MKREYARGRTAMLLVRLAPAEKAELESLARSEGVSLSAVARRLLRRQLELAFGQSATPLAPPMKRRSPKHPSRSAPGSFPATRTVAQRKAAHKRR